MGETTLPRSEVVSTERASNTQFVLARSTNGAVYPAQVIQRARLQLAAMEREPDGSWQYKEIIYPTKDAIIQELTGTTAEEAFSPAVLEEFLSSTPAVPGGEEMDRAEAGGDMSQAGEETTDFIEAEDVDVVPEALYINMVENAAKGHVEATKKEISEGTHDVAMTNELARWSELGVLEPNDTPPPDVKPISTRWVHTWKLKDGVRKAKARLVAQGFKDHRDKASIETYSGTADKDLVYVCLCYIVSRGWDLAKTDVTTAFLQAPMDQKVWVTLPKLLPNTVPKDWKPGLSARAVKAVYGLVDSPKLYTSYFKEKAATLGWIQVAESILLKKDKTGTVTALMIMHVDDLLVAAQDPVTLINKELMSVVQLDEAELLQEGQEFVYIGLTLKKKQGKLLCDQSAYIKNVQLDLKRKVKTIKRNTCVRPT
eukprot:GHVR01011669.1.p1 GENE.GHVR01011669.1~~GHVR01011669.1.p1  ORF type:complete len:427 (+),score=81.19 GHVR01011669.1:405-1685(+)